MFNNTAYLKYLKNIKTFHVIKIILVFFMKLIAKRKNNAEREMIRVSTRDVLVKLN